MPKTTKNLHLKIFLLSFLILFWEMLLIRWISTEINIFAYLQNAILIICFLGLGMGMLGAGKKIAPRESLFSIAVLILLVFVPIFHKQLLKISWGLSLFHDFLVWDQGEVHSEAVPSSFLIGASLVLLYIICALIWTTMVPLGKRLGELFQESSEPVSAYSFDILGSVLGIWLFTFLGIECLPPSAWLTIGILLYALWLKLDRQSTKVTTTIILFCLVTTASLGLSDSSTFWTPYQKLSITPAESIDEFRLWVNNSEYQQIQNNSPAFKAKNPELFTNQSATFSQYDLPFLLHPNPQQILILGAGSGNDIAGALRNTSATITAVEIDPQVVQIGKQFHPEHPFQNTRVRLEVDDARAFFNNSTDQFDLIVLGLLDAHTTPNLSNARLDNFVYTKESIRAAQKRLAPGGTFVMMFAPKRGFVTRRLVRMLAESFGTMPKVYEIPASGAGWGATIFLQGDLTHLETLISQNPDLANFLSVNTITVDESNLTVEGINDNWPYLYILKPSIPTLFYALALCIFFLWFSTSYRLEGKLILPEKSWSSAHFAFLGTAFLLLEVFAIHRCSLLFGSTWLVNSVAITAILLMILLANYSSRIIPSSWRTPVGYFGLILAFAFLSHFEWENLLSFSYSKRLILAFLLTGLPLFFSGLVFIDSFAKAPRADKALAANLFGALIGAVLQLISFRFGIDALQYLAAAFYCCSALCLMSMPSFKNKTISFGR